MGSLLCRLELAPRFLHLSLDPPPSSLFQLLRDHSGCSHAKTVDIRAELAIGGCFRVPFRRRIFQRRRHFRQLLLASPLGPLQLNSLALL